MSSNESIVEASITDLDAKDLKGKRIAAPQIFLKQQPGGPYISETIEPLWRQAKADIKAAGASVEIIPDLPVLRVYEQMLRKPDIRDASASSLPHLPEGSNSTERGLLIAHAWEDFLQNNHDPQIQSLTQVDPRQIFPHLPPDDPQVKFTEPANAVQWAKLASHIADRSDPTRPDKSVVYEVPHLEDAVRALEQIRIRFFEDWMSTQNYDFVAFPAAGDVACADADIDDSSAQHAWTDGVKYSHGNRALRHLGIPSVTVPMGLLKGSNMPMGLTFLSRAYDDINLLQAGYAYEQSSKRRVAPPLTPLLQSDEIPKDVKVSSGLRPNLSVTRCHTTPAQDGKINVSIEGAVSGPPALEENFNPNLEIYIDGQRVPGSLVSINTSKPRDESPSISGFSCEYLTAAPPVQDSRNRVVGKIARDSTMVMILARNGAHGRPSGYVKLLHKDKEKTSREI